MSRRNMAASVRARLLNRAHETRQDFNLILTRYALERLLYRLSISPHADRFLLKGALLFDLWFDIPHRPTRDADLLCFGPAEIPHVEAAFRDICAVELNDLWILSRYTDFDGALLCKAIHATFERRRTPLPDGVPFGLSDEFAQDRQKQSQWQAFVRKNALEELHISAVVAGLRAFLWPPLDALRQAAAFPQTWLARNGWTSGSEESDR